MPEVVDPLPALRDAYREVKRLAREGDPERQLPAAVDGLGELMKQGLAWQRDVGYADGRTAGMDEAYATETKAIEGHINRIIAAEDAIADAHGEHHEPGFPALWRACHLPPCRQLADLVDRTKFEDNHL